MILLIDGPMVGKIPSSTDGIMIIQHHIGLCSPCAHLLVLIGQSTSTSQYIPTEMGKTNSYYALS